MKILHCMQRPFISACPDSHSDRNFGDFRCSIFVAIEQHCQRLNGIAKWQVKDAGHWLGLHCCSWPAKLINGWLPNGHPDISVA